MGSVALLLFFQLIAVLGIATAGGSDDPVVSSPPTSSSFEREIPATAASPLGSSKPGHDLPHPKPGDPKPPIPPPKPKPGDPRPPKPKPGDPKPKPSDPKPNPGSNPGSNPAHGNNPGSAQSPYAFSPAAGDADSGILSPAEPPSSSEELPPPPPPPPPTTTAPPPSSAQVLPPPPPPPSPEIPPPSPEVLPPPSPKTPPPATTAAAPPPPTTAAAPLPPTTAAAPPPPTTAALPPPPPASIAKVVIKGNVTCSKCWHHHYEHYEKPRHHHHNNDRHHKSHNKPQGISGVTVVLSCPSTTSSTKTNQHGKYKMQFRETIPSGFPSACSIYVRNSTLPESCNVSTTATSYTPELRSSSGSDLTYSVPPFVFRPEVAHDC